MTALSSASWAVSKLIQDAGGLAWFHYSDEERVTHILGVYSWQIAVQWKESLPPAFGNLLLIPNGCSIWFPSSLKQPIFKMLDKNLFSRSKYCYSEQEVTQSWPWPQLCLLLVKSLLTKLILPVSGNQSYWKEMTQNRFIFLKWEYF